MNNIELEVGFKDTEEMEISGLYPAGPKGDPGEKGEKGEKGDPGAQLRVLVVDEIPENEENGVLYLVKESTTPAVINLYPTQQSISNTENGCTVSFTDKQVSINGTPTSSMWGWTHHFTMPLESGKSYTFKLTNFSGSFDNSARVEGGGDDIVVKVLLYGYLADDTEVALINKEISAADIYNNINFGVGNNYVEYYLSLQAKGNVAFSNWTCDISITEV